MSEERKCIKPGCGALMIIGKACLDRDCPQMWVHYTAYNAEISRLTRELEEAKAENERWRRLLGPADQFFADAFSTLLDAGTYEGVDLKEGPQGNDYQELADNVLSGILHMLKKSAIARSEVLEEAAKYHDDQVQQIADLAAQNKHHHVLYDKLTADVITHQRHAAAIRALKEKP